MLSKGILDFQDFVSPFRPNVATSSAPCCYCLGMTYLCLTLVVCAIFSCL